MERDRRSIPQAWPKLLARLVLLLFLGLGAWRPNRCLGQQISYEGQAVAYVDVIARPGVDVDALRRLLALKAGATYSDAQVQVSIDALAHAGKFTHVVLKVRPEAEGLRVMFICQPVFYLGVVKFPGAGKAFNYGQLLQTVNFSSEDPYEAGWVSSGRDALLKLFKKNGYFAARVRAATELDEPHRLANVVFNVTLNKKARVGQVKVTGTDPKEAAHLEGTVHSFAAKLKAQSLSPGKPFRPKRIQAAVANMQEELTDQGHIAAKITTEPPVFHPETSRADVIFSVNLGLQVSVRLRGARLSAVPFLNQRRLRDQIPIYEENSVDPDLIEEGKENLTAYFQKKGYFDVNVRATTESTPQRVSVTYDVDKGKKHEVATISVKGGPALDQEDLAENLGVKSKGFLSRGSFSDDLLQQSAASLTALYQDAGYQDVKVVPHVVDREPRLYLTFQVTQGPRTFVDSVRIEGNQHISTSRLTAHPLDIRPGQPYSPKRVSDDRNHLAAVYLNQGYLQAAIESTVTSAAGKPDHLDVVYRIEEGPQSRIASVITLGQQVTRQGLIDRTAGISPGEPLSQGKLLSAESQLYNLGVFDWVSIAPAGSPGEDTADPNDDVLIKVHEAPRNSVAYGVGLEVAQKGGQIPAGTVALPGLPPVFLANNVAVSGQATLVSPRASFEYNRDNLRGLGQTASVAVLVGRLDQRGLLSYADPHLLGGRWSALWSISAERTSENPIYTARLGEAAFQIAKPITRHQTALFRYSFNRTDLTNLLIPDLVLPKDRNVTLSTLSASWVNDSRDEPLDPHHGLYQTVDFNLSPEAIGSSANVARFLGQFAYYRPVLNPNLIWANSIRIGFARGFAGSTVPLSDSFFTGGATTLRGFPINGAGPQRAVPVCSNPNDPKTCTNIEVPVGGTQLAILNSEMRFPLGLYKGLTGAAFYDGGNVFSHIGFHGQYTNTVGFGVRYETPVGPIRLDVGRLLNPIPGLNPTQFFITIGQAF